MVKKKLSVFGIVTYMFQTQVKWEFVKFIQLLFCEWQNLKAVAVGEETHLHKVRLSRKWINWSFYKFNKDELKDSKGFAFEGTVEVHWNIMFSRISC